MSTPALAASNPRKGSVTAAIIIALPIVLIAACFATKFGYFDFTRGARAALLFVLLMAMMATGMPISIALGLTVLAFLFTMTEVPIESVGLKLFTGLDNFQIMAIPFFILAGNFLIHGGVAQRMISFATALVGHWYGGLGLAGVMACALFAAISGSSVATVVAIGSIILPAMVKFGYPPRFGAGVIATSGALGILFPPSINLVIYAVATSGQSAIDPAGHVTTSASVGQLFIAGVVPGLVLATMLGLTTWYRAWKFDLPRMKPEGGRTGAQATMSAFFGLLLCVVVTALPIFLAMLVALVASIPLMSAFKVAVGINALWLVLCSLLFPKRLSLGFLTHEAHNVWNAYWESIWGLLLIAIVLGGIYSGLFTPTEAAAMAAVYSFVVAVFVYKDLKLAGIPKVLLNAASMSSMILYIVTNAVLFSFIMTSEQIPHALAEWMSTQGLGLVTFLLVINVLLLAAGNFMDPAAIVLIMAPILFPVAVRLGVHPVHLGILIAVNMEVGLCHPPVGLNLYVASGITKMGITELTIAVLPWLFTMLVFLVLVTYWPPLSLWLPGLFGVL